MNKLSEAIEQAKQDCLIYGNGEIRINNITISADWEEWEEDSNFDVISIYIYKNGFIKFRYQLEETKTESE